MTKNKVFAFRSSGSNDAAAAFKAFKNMTLSTSNSASPRRSYSWAQILVISNFKKRCNWNSAMIYHRIVSIIFIRLSRVVTARIFIKVVSWRFPTVSNFQLRFCFWGFASNVCHAQDQMMIGQLPISSPLTEQNAFLIRTFLAWCGVTYATHGKMIMAQRFFHLAANATYSHE